MNDRCRPQEAVSDLRVMMKKALNITPDVEILLVSTMVPNPRMPGVNKGQYKQEKYIIKLTDELAQKGVHCATLRMTSFSKAILKRKTFRDYTGNNVNHINDFFSRIYAQGIYQTVKGYQPD